MKNITISVDDEIYRKARVKAAQHDTSLSALVKTFLVSLTSDSTTVRDLKKEQESLLDKIWQRHQGFNNAENLSRDSLHERV